MITFPLKKEYFDMIQKGLKNWEYRELTTYWFKRISKLNEGDSIKFTCGYSKHCIYAKVVNIWVMSFQHLPKYARKFFKTKKLKTNKFFGIRFEVTGQTR